MPLSSSILARGGVDPSVVTNGFAVPAPGAPALAQLPEPPVVNGPVFYAGGDVPGVLKDAQNPPDLEVLPYGASKWQDDGAFHTFSGSDIRVVLDMPGNPVRQLLEVTTISVSVHRVKTPARALGYTNPKGFARGSRTVAGTIVLTQFNLDFLYRFLGQKYAKDFSKSDQYTKIDQLPPFNLTINMMDEQGVGSYRALYGVELSTDGAVYSSNDFYSEQTVSYYAADFTPLLPVSYSAINKNSDRAVTAEKNARDVVLAKRVS